MHCDGLLPPLNLLLNGTYPWYLQGVCHWETPPLYFHRTLSRLPAICLATWWWKPYRNFTISLVTTRIYQPYSNTVYTTTLYIIACVCAAGPVLVNTFAVIPDQRRTFCRFWYSVAYSLLLNLTLRPKYRKTATGSKVSDFTLIANWLASKQYCIVSYLLCLSSPRWNMSNS